MSETTGTWSKFRIPRGSNAASKVEDAPAPVTTAAPAPVAKPISGTFIGLDARFEGSLRLKGDFRIDNEFRGVLKTDGTVVVGPNGSIEGDIFARQVEIEGAVVGNVNARRMFVLRASGKLHGDIETACLQIEPHAFFQGGTRMTLPVAEAASQGATTAHV